MIVLLFPFALLLQLLFSFLLLQSEHDGSDVQVDLNVEHIHEADIIPNMTRSPRVKYITYYEDAESLPGKRTAVWELDKSTFYLTSNLVSHVHLGLVAGDYKLMLVLGSGVRLHF